MTSLRGASRWIAAALVPFLFACAASEGPSTPVPVASVTVLAPVSSLVVGATTTLTAALKNAAGEPLPGRAVTWSSSSESVATVTDAGVVSAISAGSVRVRATSENVYGEIELAVRPRSSLVATIRLDAQSITLTAGGTRQLTATPLDEQGGVVTGVDVVWSLTGDVGAARISPSGLLTAIELGTATIKASVGERFALATATILGKSDYDLVFDRWSVDVVGIMRPWIHRLDMRTPGAEPISIFTLPNTWDASASPDGSRTRALPTGVHASVSQIATVPVCRCCQGSAASLVCGRATPHGVQTENGLRFVDGRWVVTRGSSTRRTSG
jgi:hypothetical protein